MSTWESDLENGSKVQRLAQWETLVKLSHNGLNQGFNMPRTMPENVKIVEFADRCEILSESPKSVRDHEKIFTPTEG